MQLKWPMLWDLFSLFPAHAGVIPRKRGKHNEKPPFPRTRGGDPKGYRDGKEEGDFSPHTRG
mgnify:CR=1 FL=1